jgi:hypothetical protein
VALAKIQLKQCVNKREMRFWWRGHQLDERLNEGPDLHLISYQFSQQWHSHSSCVWSNLRPCFGWVLAFAWIMRELRTRKVIVCSNNQQVMRRINLFMFGWLCIVAEALVAVASALVMN